MLIGSFGCSDQIIGLVKDAGLPLETDETLVCEDVATGQVVNDAFSRQTLICIGWDEVIHNRNTAQGCNRNQFVAKVIQLTAGAMPITGTPGKVTGRFAPFVSKNRNRFGIQQIVATQMVMLVQNPIPTLFFDQ